jgi:hypothetical protein
VSLRHFFHYHSNILPTQTFGFKPDHNGKNNLDKSTDLDQSLTPSEALGFFAYFCNSDSAQNYKVAARVRPISVAVQ